MHITTVRRIHRDIAGLGDFNKAPDDAANIISSSKRRFNEFNFNAHALVLAEETEEKIISFNDESPEKGGESKIL